MACLDEQGSDSLRDWVCRNDAHLDVDDCVCSQSECPRSRWERLCGEQLAGQLGTNQTTETCALEPQSGIWVDDGGKRQYRGSNLRLKPRLTGLGASRAGDVWHDGHVCLCETEIIWDEAEENIVEYGDTIRCSHCRGEHLDCETGDAGKAVLEETSDADEREANSGEKTAGEAERGFHNKDCKCDND